MSTILAYISIAIWIITAPIVLLVAALITPFDYVYLKIKRWINEKPRTRK
jgi:hypothetical protein